MRHVSTGVMIKQLVGLLGTNDLTEWEKGFVRSLSRASDRGEVLRLSDKQVEVLERVYNKHFA